MYLEDRAKYDQAAKEWTEKYATRDYYTENERLLSVLSEHYNLANVVDTLIRNNWNEREITEVLEKKQ